METRSVVHDGLRHGAGPVPPGREPPKRQSLASRVAALEARVAELTAEVQARDEFIAVTAHELRNPMVPVSGQVELLLNSPGDCRSGPSSSPGWNGSTAPSARCSSARSPC